METERTDVKEKVYVEENRDVEVEGQIVTLNIRHYKYGESPEKAIFFTPGWEAKDSQTLVKLNQAFVREGKRDTYQIAARMGNVVEGSSEIKARAIAKFADEKGISELTGAGASEGGAIMSELAADGRLDGLLLIDSLGLYDQSKIGLVNNFGLDGGVTFGVMLKKLVKERSPEGLKQGTQVVWDITLNVLREMGRSGAYYPVRFLKELREMVRKNTRLNQIECPVVLIQGANDRVSSPSKIIPTEGDREFWSDRRRFLKEFLFTNAVDVSMLVASRMGYHGLAHFRPDEVAKVGLYQLRRHKESGIADEESGELYHPITKTSITRDR